MSARERDRGSTTAEFVVLVPLLIGALMFLVAIGRLSTSRLAVAEAAHSAARAASLAQTAPAAASAAKHALDGSLPAGTAACFSHDVTVDTSAFRPGGSVTVTVSCHARLEDLTGAFVPGSSTITETFRSPIDPFEAVP